MASAVMERYVCGAGPVISGKTETRLPVRSYSLLWGKQIIRLPGAGGALPRDRLIKVGELKNRVTRAALTTVLAAATALFGLAVPAAPALAAQPTISPTGKVSAQALVDPAFTVVRSDGNEVVLTMKGGAGRTARLKMTANGKQTVWTAPASADKDVYKVTVPFPVTANGFVTVVPASVRNGVEIVFRGWWQFWCTPTSAPTPAEPTKPVPAPKIALNEYMPVPDRNGTEAQKTRYFSFSGNGFAGSRISLQRKNSGAWKTVWTSKVLTDADYDVANGGKLSFASEGSATVRAILVKGGKTVATTETKTIKYARAITQVFSTGNIAYGEGLFAAARGHVAAGTQRSHSYTMYYATKDRSGYLQEYKAGKWVTVQTVLFKKAAGYKVTVKTPLTRGTVTRKYRFYVPSNSSETSWTSKSVTIAHTGKN
ncbi:MAG: hypothetical protein JWM13_2301 [Arthrobacter sp.]|nr:hypothetical protein [Arthrobacter sp.]